MNTTSTVTRCCANCAHSMLVGSEAHEDFGDDVTGNQWRVCKRSNTTFDGRYPVVNHDDWCPHYQRFNIVH